jgi:hypothetical protein
VIGASAAELIVKDHRAPPTELGQILEIVVRQAWTAVQDEKRQLAVRGGSLVHHLVPGVIAAKRQGPLP